MNRKGISILELVVSIPITIGAAFAIASVIHSFTIGIMRNAYLNEISRNLNAATEHIIKIGRTATTCAKGAGSQNGSGVLECIVDFDGLGVPIGYSNVRFEASNNFLIYKTRPGAYATEEWGATELKYSGISGFELCDRSDIENALKNPVSSDPSINHFCGTVNYSNNGTELSNRFFRFGLAHSNKTALQSSFFTRNAGFANNIYQWGNWD